jgi:hypothetical protein
MRDCDYKRPIQPYHYRCQGSIYFEIVLKDVDAIFPTIEDFEEFKKAAVSKGWTIANNRKSAVVDGERISTDLFHGDLSVVFPERNGEVDFDVNNLYVQHVDRHGQLLIFRLAFRDQQAVSRCGLTLAGVGQNILDKQFKIVMRANLLQDKENNEYISKRVQKMIGRDWKCINPDALSRVEIGNSNISITTSVQEVMNIKIRDEAISADVKASNDKRSETVPQNNDWCLIL